MSALCYLSRKQIKNFIKELAHHPGKLVLYIILIAGISAVSYTHLFDPIPRAAKVFSPAIPSAERP